MPALHPQTCHALKCSAEMGLMMIKIGIIGFGYMGRFHFEKSKNFKEIKVTGVYDADSGKRDEAQKNGLDTYSDLGLFLSTDMDAIVIATPNQWHAKYAIAAMRAGKNVMCEKPATMSVNEMKDIMAVSKETGKFFTVHQQRRWDSDFRLVSDIIRSGKIGNVTTIESRVLGERGVCFGWRAEPESGGGMLYDWGAHLIDQILQLYDKEHVISVYARVLSVLTPAVDDFFEITLILSNGVCAKITVGTFALQKLPRWFVFGDRGTLKLDDFSGEIGGISRIRGDVQGFDSVVGQKVLGPSRTMAPLKKEHIEKIDLPYVADQSLVFWNNFVAAVKGEENLYVTQEQILRQMMVVEAAFESAEKNEVIKVRI